MLLFAVLALVAADIYLQNPRDDQENIQNHNRLFNSFTYYSDDDNLGNRYYSGQGGYNAPLPGNSMYYFSGSELTVEWTIDQGCGSNDGKIQQNVAHCDIILQYTCSEVLRDGSVGNTIPDTMEAEMERDDSNFRFQYGMHENYAYYKACKDRPRNMGLFTGDRSFAQQSTSARFTRQNPGGARFGYECPEEREYYPYWTPTPWRDIAVITDTPQRCEYYKTQSQNVASNKCWCKTPNKLWQSDCPAANWTCAPPWSSEVDAKAPECITAPWLQDTLLSNKEDGHTMSYNWTVPQEPALACAMRVRYNVTVGDWPTWWSDELSNVPQFSAGVAGSKSTWLDYTWNGVGVSPFAAQETLNLCETPSSKMCNISIFTMPEFVPSRTYEDRSHRFSILPAPATIKNAIKNFNVRGKRGNIVQAFPATEYDFVPTIQSCKVGEWLHVQWTGSDENRNNVAGEGTDQTDRNNMIQIESAKHNFPIGKDVQNLFFKEAAMNAAYLGFHNRASICKDYDLVITSNNNDNDREQDPRNCAKLNPGSPYFDGGLQPCLMPGVYHFMCTRNNNYTNRSQKGTIVVHPCSDGPTCSNADSLPLGADGVYNPYGQAAGSSLTAATAVLALALSSVLF